jgi:uncharacterized protein (DUF1778 family)
MAKPTRQTPNSEGSIQLGFRGSAQEQILLNHAAKLQNRSRNSFLKIHSLQAARAVLKENGVDETSLFPKASKVVRSRAKAA